MEKKDATLPALRLHIPASGSNFMGEHMFDSTLTAASLDDCPTKKDARRTLT